MAEMSTGSGWPAVDRPGIDFQVQFPWNAPETYVTLDSARAYDLNTTFVPDVLGLRAQRSEAAVVKVMTGRDSRSVRVLVLDEKMKDRGLHDVTLLDMGGCRRAGRLRGRLVHSSSAVAIVSSFRVGPTTTGARPTAPCVQETLSWNPDGLAFFFGKVIKLDLTRHVANYHLELVKLWRCPFSWAGFDLP